MNTTRAFVIACGLLAAMASAHAESVGNVGAVNQSANGTPPGGKSHSLSLGGDVQKRERIETGAAGTAQIVFRDTSTMTVGRNSAVTVDDFVYNSKAQEGRQGVTVAKGVLRFVGGGVSHNSGANLRTPTASIGVRGGMAIVKVGGECGTLVVLQYGAATVANGSGSQTLNHSGYGVCAPAGGPISSPFHVSNEETAQLMAQVVSSIGQNGGAAAPPANSQAQLRLTNHRPPNDVPPPGLDDLNHFWGGEGLVQSAANPTNQPNPPPPQEHEHYMPPFPDYRD